MHTKRFRLSILFFCIFLAFITIPYGQSSYIFEYLSVNLGASFVRTVLENGNLIVMGSVATSISFYYFLNSLVSLFLSTVSSIFLAIALISYIVHVILKKQKKIILFFSIIISSILLIAIPTISLFVDSFEVIIRLFDLFLSTNNNLVQTNLIEIIRISRAIVSFLPSISLVLFFVFIIFVAWTSDIKKGFKILLTVLFTFAFLIALTIRLLNVTDNILFSLLLNYDFIPDWYLRYSQNINTISSYLSITQIFFTKTLALGCILGIIGAIFTNSYLGEKKYIYIYIIPFIVTSFIIIFTILYKVIYIIFMIITLTHFPSIPF